MTPGRTQFPRTGRSGFTLIEILSVVVILGIISATIIPQIATREDLRAASASRVVMAGLLYAQNRAVTQQRVHFVVFDVTNKNFSILDRWSPANVIKNPVEASPYLVEFEKDGGAGLKEMTLVSAAFDSSTVLAFDVMGIPQTVDAFTGAMKPLTSGQIVVGSGKFTLTITVSPYSGELTVQ